MTNLTGMFEQLNNTIKETPLAAKGPGTPPGMPYNPMDNVNPMMQQFAPVSYTHLTLPTIYSV